jgi:hypothetical protein
VAEVVVAICGDEVSVSLSGAGTAIGAQEPIELDAEVRQGEVISQNVKYR